MSEQPPLASPSGPEPTFEPYAAPAWGSPEPPAPTGAPPCPPAPPVSPGGGQPYQVAPQYLGAVGAPTHPLAVTSLVLGVLAVVGVLLTPVFLVTFVAAAGSPFAIWLSVRARREIRASPHLYGGEGIATAGLVTGVVGLVLGILGLLVVLALVAFVAAVFSSTP